MCILQSHCILNKFEYSGTFSSIHDYLCGSDGCTNVCSTDMDQIPLLPNLANRPLERVSLQMEAHGSGYANQLSAPASSHQYTTSAPASTWGLFHLSTIKITRIPRGLRLHYPWWKHTRAHRHISVLGFTSFPFYTVMCLVPVAAKRACVNCTVVNRLR